MFLKALEMQGFKSFPDKTVLEFGKGITSVVGPNGSGKSNIADAVRWVLGEQSSKNLRGSKMEDVIFSGTNIRKAQGFAEVTLRLDNTDRTLLSDKDEVTVTRRYYRSGESEYILNGEVCRLKDVNEMFMDTGLGRDGYSMVSQGRVADMVSSKSNQRRDMLEEAAGISHYRYRRNDANRKLALAEENMIRLRDILTELESRVGPLKVQSEKAQKFLVLAEERKTLEIGLWLHTIDRVREQLRQHEDKLTIAAAQYEAVETELEKIVEDMEAAMALSQADTVKIDEMRRSASELEEQAAQIDAKIAVELNSIEHNNATIERITREMEAAVESKQDLDDEITETMQTVELLKKAEKQKLELLEAAAAKIEAIRSESRSFAEQIAEQSEQIAQLAQQIGDKRVAISTAKSSAEEITLRLETIDEVAASRSEAIAKLDGQLTEALDQLKAAEQTVTELTNAVKGYEMKVNSRGEKADAKRREMEEAEREIDRKRSRAKMLDDLEKNMEGYSGSVKAVMKEVKRGTMRGIRGVLSQLISVQEEYSVAIETALGNALQDIVTENENDAKRAINFLKDNRLGRATFLPVSAIRGRKLEEKGLEDQYGFIAVADELVGSDNGLREIISSLLGKTIVVEDMDCAVSIAKKYGHRFKIVTLDGQVVNPGGSMTGGSRTQNAGILSRANEIERLNAECLKLEQEQETRQSDYKQLLSDLAACRSDLIGTQADLTRAQEDVIRREGEIKLLRDRLSDTTRSFNELQTEKETAGERLASLNKTIEQIQGEIAALDEQIVSLREVTTELNQSREQLTLDEDENRKAESRAKLDLLAVQKDIQSKQETVAMLRHRMTNQGLRMEDLNREISGIADGSREIKANIKELERQAEELRARGKTSNDDVEKLIADKQQQDELAMRLRQEERAKSADREKIGGEVARLEERKTVMEKELDDTMTKLYDEYQLSRREAQELGIVLEDIGEARRRLQEIKNKIRALGSVNVGAIDEYKEVSERYEYMSAQISDIEKSKFELEKLIAELTSKMAEQFREQFARINRHFGETFAELFDGGKAELVLEDEHNVLECPIEIKVQPPGKNVQNIDLLSGGEKGLSAIALLFAILKVSPAPFCFFDEVEAALDEVNVARYAQYARRMTANTQFILITHRRGTMEEADVLYGVTMQEKGVSKLLELKTAEVARKLGIA
ncbi:MAG: chromosome segregation protein SMC [Clostridia bacterium]|nr:chromosome segregation protein SMC [Clostridia bacterium]